jgi:hypothetical protein
MPRKRTQHLVRPALDVHRCCQVVVQTLDRHRHRPGATLRPLPAQPRTLPQMLRNLLQLTLRLGFQRLDFKPVLQHPFQLPLPAPQCPHCRLLLQAHRPLLQRFISFNATKCLPGL